MPTIIVELEPGNIAASLRSLREEFDKAKIPNIKTAARKGAVYVTTPVARFSSSGESCEWKTIRKKITLRSKGFDVERRIDRDTVSVIFRPAPGVAANNASPVRQVFLQRSLRAIQQLQSLDESHLCRAVQEPTDCSVLLSALNTGEALAAIRSQDPLAGARLRGLEAKRSLLEAEGGSLSTDQLAAALDITRQAVDKRRKEGKLLAVELGKKGFHYPAWQIGLPHIQEVLRALGDRGAWDRISFFLNPNALLGDKTPLEVLREGKPDARDVLRAASAFGEQGG